MALVYGKRGQNVSTISDDPAQPGKRSSIRPPARARGARIFDLPSVLRRPIESTIIAPLTPRQIPNIFAGLDIGRESGRRCQPMRASWLVDKLSYELRGRHRYSARLSINYMYCSGSDVMA